MTDKQIIIDGVDVSDCKNLMQGIVPFGCMEDRKTCSCMNNPNCSYKNWKRKEQECEELNKEIHNLNSTINFIRVTEHSAINKYNKLKQALTEIKEIAKHFTKKGLEPQSVEHQLKLRGKEELAKIILQKCEVLDERRKNERI